MLRRGKYRAKQSILRMTGSVMEREVIDESTEQKGTLKPFKSKKR